MGWVGLWSVFLTGSVLSLGTSWVVAARIERIGARLGLSEALLGLVAALAADTPEISTAISALARHQTLVGAGVVIGSNVFNLAALLGLGALVAGFIGLHRRVVLLAGSVATWVAVVCLLAILGVVGPAPALGLVLVMLVPYSVLAGIGATRLARRPWGWRAPTWLVRALAEEESELAEPPVRGGSTFGDTAAALAGLVVVVMSSVAVESVSTTLGNRLHVPDIVTGGLVLAAITSLPNAVAAVYLARRGRGAATLSTALNSNALNVAVGFLLPASVTGFSSHSTSEQLVGWWYVGLTLMALALCFAGRGLRRRPAVAVVAAYVAFALTLAVSAG